MAGGTGLGILGLRTIDSVSAPSRGRKVDSAAKRPRLNAVLHSLPGGSILICAPLYVYGVLWAAYASGPSSACPPAPGGIACIKCENFTIRLLLSTGHPANHCVQLRQPRSGNGHWHGPPKEAEVLAPLAGNHNSAESRSIIMDPPRRRRSCPERCWDHLADRSPF